jgi:hypothetical protein
MSEKEFKNVDYLQLGFDKFGLRRVSGTEQMSSNLADYVLELAEYSVSNKKVKDVSADKITAGTLAAVTNVGDESIQLDGEDKTFKIYDNSTPAKVSIYMKGGSA